MTDFYLHIGMTKTSTSFLQETFFPSLSSKEIFYNPNEILNLLYPYLKKLNNDEIIYEKEIIFLKTEIKKFVSKTNAKKIIFSFEEYSVKEYNFDYTKRLIFLSKIFHNAKLICFLRNQVSWIRSMYKQALHQQVIKNINEFLVLKSSKTTDPFQINIKNLDYYKFVEFIRGIYGYNNCFFIFYENYLTNQPLYIMKILSFLNIDKKSLNNLNKKRVNKSISMLGLTIIIFINKFFIKFKLKLPYRFHIVLRNIFQKYLDSLFFIDWDPLEKYTDLYEAKKWIYKINMNIDELQIDDKTPKSYKMD